MPFIKSSLKINCCYDGCAFSPHSMPYFAFCSQLSGSLTESIVPFDATSETPLEEQRTEAMVRVQDALLVRLGPEALALLRAARSVKHD